MRKIIFLLSIIFCQYLPAQTVTKKELTSSAWQYQKPKGMHMAGPMVLEFSDSLMTKTMFYPGSGGNFVLGKYEYYLSDTDNTDFKANKVGRKSVGQYLIYRRTNGGDVNSEQLSIEDKNILRVTKGDRTVDCYTRLSDDSLKAYKAENKANLNEEIALFNAALHIKTVDLEVSGEFIWKMENNEIDLGDAQGLSIRGPLRALDVWELRNMLVGEDAKYPKIKILDLSRAWIVTDTLTFGRVFMNHDPEKFMSLTGHHYTAKASEFIDLLTPDECVDPDTRINVVRHGYGTTIELPALPRSKDKYYHKPTYIKFLSTRADCIPEFMLEDMQNVQILILPQYTRQIRYAAFQNCKKISKVTIPPYVQKVEDNAFAGCAENFSITNAPKPAKPLVNALADTLKNDSLREAYRVMNVLRKKVSSLDDMLHRQTDADSIKIYRARREDAVTELQKKLIYYTMVQADSTVAPVLLSLFRDYAGMDVIRCLLYMAKDDIAFSPRCYGLWSQLRKLSDLHQIDPVYNDPEKMTHVTVYNPGTLESHMVNEELDKIKQLRITGPLDKTDILWLANIKSHLYSLDLSEAVIDEIPEEAFFNFKLHYLALPKSLHTVGKAAFQACRNLTEVVFGDSLQEIGKLAFALCDLNKVSLPSSLRRVDMRAFARNDNLTEIEFPEGTDTIAVAVMERCSKLERVKIPASARLVGTGLINSCPNAKVEVHPDNPNYTAVEGELVGKNDRTKVFLKQAKMRSRKEDMEEIEPKSETDKKLKRPLMGGKLVLHYKKVNGKSVLQSAEVKK